MFRADAERLEEQGGETDHDERKKQSITYDIHFTD